MIISKEEKLKGILIKYVDVLKSRKLNIIQLGSRGMDSGACMYISWEDYTLNRLLDNMLFKQGIVKGQFISNTPSINYIQNMDIYLGSEERIKVLENIINNL